MSIYFQPILGGMVYNVPVLCEVAAYAIIYIICAFILFRSVIKYQVYDQILFKHALAEIPIQTPTKPIPKISIDSIYTNGTRKMLQIVFITAGGSVLPKPRKELLDTASMHIGI